MDINNIMTKLDAFFKSEEGRQSLERYSKKQLHSKFIDKKMCDKLHKLSIDEREDIIDKLIEKYNSDSYIARYNKIRLYPTYELYFVLLYYGKMYGVYNEDGSYTFDRYNILAQRGLCMFFEIEKILN